MSDATYRLCPQCQRAVPTKSGERYCPNDGTKMISHCPVCRTPIRNPYARHCTRCGLEFMPSKYRDAEVRSVNQQEVQTDSGFGND